VAVHAGGLRVAGVLIALAFLVIAFVSMPLAAWFVTGAVLIGL
jgi:hypothetical protein